MNELEEYKNQDLFNPKYLFHGTNQEIEKLECRKSTDSNNKENEDNAIFLTSSFYTAAAYAFSRKLKETNDNYSFSINNDCKMPIMTFEVDNLPENLYSYIYVFDKTDDMIKDKYKYTTQYRCYHDLIPKKVIKVNYKDYEEFFYRKNNNIIKEYYHVVTERPMRLGDEIIIDQYHHSGVYERVHNLLDKVEDIYSNPDKYKNIELDHHTKVALRELALEEIRKNKYPNYPSRLASLYVSNTLEEAERWYDYFISLNRPTYQIVKVSVEGASFTGDACNCFDGTIDKKYNLEQAEIYWEGKDNTKGKKPIYETIVDGKIKVIEIIKNNDM